ncbi:hypothetical protein ACSTS3_18135 [Aquimarina muelleri]|uniref:hypothetical protein n=1 Tax=Aquimarina muelleri TaxID=279356 RepID=UPI003F687CC7
MKIVHTCLLICLSVLATSCLKDHNIPPITLHYKQIEPFKDQNNIDSYRLYFTSDINIDSIANIKRSNPQIICPLVGKENFEVGDYHKQVIKSLFIEKDTKPKNYINEDDLYSVELLFYEYDEDGSQSRYLEKNEIIDLIKNKKCIPCTMYMVFPWRYKHYYSNPMCIPVEDILKVLKD